MSRYANEGRTFVANARPNPLDWWEPETKYVGIETHRARFVCGMCKTPTCSGVIFLCTGCARPSMCQGKVDASYAEYGRAQTPGFHFFVRGMGEMWDCGPLRPIHDGDVELGPDPSGQEIP